MKEDEMRVMAVSLSSLCALAIVYAGLFLAAERLVDPGSVPPFYRLRIRQRHRVVLQVLAVSAVGLAVGLALLVVSS